jgi:hypothetical protein
MPKQPTLTTKKLIALDPIMMREIESYRFSERIKSESEAIRRLIEIGLDASSSAPKRATLRSRK